MLVEHFLNQTEKREYSFLGQKIDLVVNKKVFPPSDYINSFCKYITINENERVIDIGTGTGIIAILASKLGGEVYATDINPDAIELAKSNAKRNVSNIKFSEGSFFGAFSEKFDLIIANLPQEIVPQKYLDCIGEALGKSINGGLNGNEVYIEFLEKAYKHMHDNSRIYVEIISLSDYKSTINQITKKYNAKLLGIEPIKAKEFIGYEIDFYTKLKNAGIVDFYVENNNLTYNGFILELTKKLD